MFWQALNILYVITVALFLFNLTIFVHELAHYLVGRWRGARIERFAIWFGPALWSKTIRNVEFRLGCIPLGGYVAFPQLVMESIEGKSEMPAEKLEPLKPKDKIPILFAGSFANLLLAFFVACIVWMVGVPKDKSDFDLKIGYVLPNTPEQAAGIQPGDRIVSINNKIVKNWEEIVQRVALSLSEKVKIGLERNGKLEVVELIPNRDNLFKIRMLDLERANIPVAGMIQPNSPAEKANIQSGDEFLAVDGEKVLGTFHLIELIKQHPNKLTHLTLLRNGKEIEIEVTPKIEKKSGISRMGVALRPKSDDQKMIVYPTPWQQMAGSLLAMADTLNALIHTKTTGVGVGDLAGPVGIGWSLYEKIKLDYRLALEFLVLLNINLAIINLFPIPVLDGGHIIFALIESIRRKPLNQKILEATQTVFIALLITFMLYITFYDISRLARWKLMAGKEKNVADRALPSFEEKISP